MAISQFSELKTALANWLKRSDLTSRIPEFVSLAEDRIAKDLRVRAMEHRAVLKVTNTIDGATVGGTADAITLTPATAATSYALGDTYKFTAASTNTSSVTVAISGLSAQSIKLRFGGVKEDPAAGDIVAGAEYRIYYDGTDFLLIPQGGVPLPARYVGMRSVYVDGTEKKLDFFPDNQFWTRNATNESNRPKIYTIEGDYLILAPVPDGAYYVRTVYYRRFTALSADADTNWVLSNHRGLYLYASLVEAMLYLRDDARLLVFSQLWQLC